MKRNSIITIILALSALLLISCELFEEDNEETTPNYSITVHGRVVNSVTGDPISNGSISKDDSNYSVYSSTSYTDSKGYFSIVINGSGSYRLEITASGYVDYTTDYQSNYSENAFYNFKDVEITPVSYDTQLYGYVRDQSYNAVSGANVTAGGSITTTNSEGYYRFSNITHYGEIIILSNGLLEDNTVSNNYLYTITTQNYSYSHNITLTPLTF